MNNLKMMQAISNMKYSIGTKVYAKFLASYHGDEYEYIPGIVIGISYDAKHERINYDVYSETAKETFKSLAEFSVVSR